MPKVTFGRTFDYTLEIFKGLKAWRSEKIYFKIFKKMYASPIGLQLPNKFTTPNYM